MTTCDGKLRFAHAVRWAREMGRWVWDFQPCNTAGEYEHRNFITKPEEVDVVDCPTCKMTFERPDIQTSSAQKTHWHVKPPKEYAPWNHGAAPVDAKEWKFTACARGTTHGAFFSAGEALCPDCGGRVTPPKLLTGEDGLVKRDIPPPPPDAPKWTAKIGEPRVMCNPRVNDLLLNAPGEVTVLASGTHIVTSPLVAQGEMAQAEVLPGGQLVFSPGGQLVFLAEWHDSDHGYVYVTALQRDGHVRTDWLCEACGAGEGEKHRNGELCPGLQKMRERVIDVPGMEGVEVLSNSAVARAPEFNLRPPRRELVVMVDDQSEPP